jgi:thiamine biosynthesis lipoprotein
VTTAAIATDTFGAFGTTAVLLVTQPDALPAARALADTELAAVDLACSRFRPDSELSTVNAAGGRSRPISVLFGELIAAALRAAQLTAGDVDPTCGQALVRLGYDRDFAQVRAGQARAGGGTGISGGTRSAGGTRKAGTRKAGGNAVPGWRSIELDQAAGRVRLRGGAQLDLGATAKAWAADRCARLIAATLGCGSLVSLGGDIAVAGPAADGGWRVRVTDDHAAGPDAPGQTVTLTEGGLATSSTTVRAWTSDGRQVHHIVDPATGEPASSCWRTVSVAAGTCVDANTASTAAIIRGEAAPGWLQDAGLPARLVRTDGTVRTTGGWPDDEPDGVTTT